MMLNIPIVQVGEEPESLPAFVVAGNGIFLRKHSALGLTQSKVTKIAHLPEAEPELDYQLPPIPAAVAAKIGGFLRAADVKYGGEGAVLLCLNEKNEWDIVIPRQDASGADVRYFVDEDTIPQGWRLMGTAHSHPFNKTSAPTPSWTDDSDEKKLDGVHLIGGRLNGQEPPLYAAHVTVDGLRWKFDSQESLIEDAIPTPIEDIPDEWLARIEKKKEKGWISKAVGGVTSYVSTGSSYGTGYYLKKATETPEEYAIRIMPALKPGSFTQKDMFESGYILEWSIREVTEEDLHKSTSTKSGQSYETLEDDDYGTSKKKGKRKNKGVGFGNDDDEAEWTNAKMVECTDRHPFKDCPANCGCHCEPCRMDLVGSWKSEATGTDRYDLPLNEKIECSCPACGRQCTVKVPYDGMWCSHCAKGDHVAGYNDAKLTADAFAAHKAAEKAYLDKDVDLPEEQLSMELLERIKTHDYPVCLCTDKGCVCDSELFTDEQKKKRICNMCERGNHLMQDEKDAMAAYIGEAW